MILSCLYRLERHYTQFLKRPAPLRGPPLCRARGAKPEFEHRSGRVPVTPDYYQCWIGSSHDSETETGDSSVMDEKD
jgi:hypothetical protein